MILALATVVLVTWVWMWLGNAWFWRVDSDPIPTEPDTWPEIVVVIPARDEEEGIEETLRSLWLQDYPLPLRIVLVDDQCEDRTIELARSLAVEMEREVELQIVQAATLPAGWTGKVWAMHEGVAHGVSESDSAEFILFSDADIRHSKGEVRELVCRATAGNHDLTSFMVKLHCCSAAERLMIPAFVFFFKMLYPFRRINNPADSLAGAAGGVMLVRRTSLDRIGGLSSIRGELIDDCALARKIKHGGNRIWVGLSESTDSTRRYRRLSEIQHMIARTAYTQLGYSPLRLAGCVVGLAVVYLAPPLLLFARGWLALIGSLAWLLMSSLYLPMVRFYRQSPIWALLLPVTAALYMVATILSAWLYHLGKGGQWKGRVRMLK